MRAFSLLGLVRAGALALGLAAAPAAFLDCTPRPPATAADAPLAQLRTDAEGSSNADVLGRWCLAEMLEPGGDAERARKARHRLDDKGLSGHGMYGPLARAMWDEAHGAPRAGAISYVTTLQAAQASSDPDAPLVAWFATHHLLGLRSGIRELYTQHKGELEPLLTRPGNLGWRALAELYEWRAAETNDRIAEPDPAADPRIAHELGCSRELRLVGPFGHGSSADRRRSFAPESSGPWPPTFAPDPLRATVPHVLPTEGRRCLVASRESTEPGVFYGETYFDLKEPRDLVVSMQGALALWIDDTKVLDRDLREWGIWQRFGVAVHLEAGRHRVRGRLLADATSVRLVNLDGQPAGVETDLDGSRPYAQSAPRVLGDPNPIDRFVHARKAPTALTAVLASYIAHIEALDDVATVLVDPYVTPKNAASLTLEAAAAFSRGDPAFPEDVRVSRERTLHQRALKAEAHLWYPAVWLALDDAEQRGPLEAIEPLRKLAAEFPEQPEIALETAGLYGKLGWRAERITSLRSLVARFPDSMAVLRDTLAVLDTEGPASEADALVPRIRALDPDSEVDLERAIARRDWPAVTHELRRLGARHPERKDLAARMANVLERAGHPAEAEKAFAQALARTPEDSALRLRLADLAYSRGDETALRKSLAGALEAGARAGELREAIDLAEGASDLEPYRMDGPKVIAEFKAWEAQHRGKSSGAGKKNDDGGPVAPVVQASAVRILDYSAVWVHPDGSSEMLEHEIQRMQSEEAIGQESEQKPPAGLVLHLRVIKPDGTVLEPEPVEGKPTLTMPHLEVGDCLEMEHVIREPGDGEKGNRYAGPTWFFREADKGYWRSEFVMLTPKERKLDIEVRGKVPAPEVKQRGPLTERRWRVDDSPPAAEEPDAVPATEFLPSVRVGWGVNLGDQVARLLDVAVDETPLDPRLGKIAAEIANGTGGAPNDDERVRRVYEWIRTNVQDGQETDGRRVVLGRSGARQAAFEHLLRELGIPVDVAIAKNRLALPPVGPMSDVDSYDTLLLRVRLRDRGERWLTVRDRFLPYGYVPAEVRGTEALLLVPGTPRVKLPKDGSIDGISFDGRADLNEDGSAKVHLVERFQGKIGTTLREVLDKVSGQQLKPFVEQRLLGRNMPDARLHDVTIEGRETLDQPLVLKAELDLPALARPLGNGRFALRSLFPAHLSALATLPSRETPLLLSAASHMETHLTIVLPPSMSLPASLDAVDLNDGDRITHVHDKVEGHALVLDRVVDMPAGRVAPGAPYAAFQRFTQASDTALEREIVIGK